MTLLGTRQISRLASPITMQEGWENDKEQPALAGVRAMAL